MGKQFTLKLAMNNIKQNRKFYLPYVLASIGIIAMFYIIWYLATNSGLKNLTGAEYITAIMALGGIIIGIFAVIFLFYINSFLMKRRSREIGLYNILGMEKRHIGKILFAENLIVSTFSILAGLICGVLFSRLVFLIVCKIMGATTPIRFGISAISIMVTVITFGAVFLLILLRNQMKIHLSKPIELLSGSNTGEREPRTKLVLSIVGVICLVSGYYISLSITDPLKAIAMFFVAVILVIIGTYLLFTTVSIAILKALKSRKSYYYKPQHFTAVSGMLYRMKQNAVGMANICILSTMVLVMISTTVCMQMGVRSVVDSITPEDAVVSVTYNNSKGMLSTSWMDKQKESLETLADNHDIDVKDVTNYSLLTFSAMKEGNSLKVVEGDSKSAVIGVTTAAEYKRLTGKDAGIAGDEMMVCDNKMSGSVSLGGQEYKIVKSVDSFMPTDPSSSFSGARDAYMFVASSAATVNRIIKSTDSRFSELTYYMMFNSSASESKTSTLAADYENSVRNGYKYANVTTRESFENQYKGLTGGFLFLGIFLGIVFTFAAALIIYYKQISEGYYDKEKFEIMQKVGMSRAEVRRTIRTQVLMVFYIPLVVAGCHMMGAFNMVRQMLRLFGLSNIGLFLQCTALTFAAFAAIYALVYFVTAKEYYKIIQQR
jgi:putative ABC transport system permease protein